MRRVTCFFAVTSALCALLVSPAVVPAMDGHAPAFDVDEQFRIARELARAGRWEEAGVLAAQILEATPEYTDVSVFLARLEAWQKDYPEARRLLNGVLAREANDVEARKALIDVEVWSGQPQAAIDLCESTLALQPEDADLRTRCDQVREALNAETGARYRGSVDYALSTFNRDFDDWHQVAVALERETARVNLIGRTTYFNRFDDDDVLFEVDVYPRLRDGTYAYLNAGVSAGDVAPKYRLAAELFQTLPWHTEASLGWRQLRFDSTSNVLTGSLAVYIGDYWIALRPYLTFVSGEEQTAVTLQGRWYYGDEEEYGTLTFGTGKSLEDTSATEELFTLESHRAALDLRKRLFAGYVVKLGLAFELQEVPESSDRESFTAGLGLDYLF